MLWLIDPRQSVPLYQQIADTIRRGIASGELTEGTRLPSAKELAASLEVNLHTVLQAYQHLRDAGVIELRRGRGAIILAAPDPQNSELGDDLPVPVMTLLNELLHMAHTHGISSARLVRHIEEASLPR